MSSDISISIDKVDKVFPVYAKPHHRLAQMMSPGAAKQRWFKEFRALSGVSFDVRKGETVGIVGRNGSGKSTLLQIICGTLAPSQGDVAVNGRVAALLELGAGFNPEFTGRENVFMNGVLLGLTRAQVEERFDAIAAFADIGDFIDQPVKSYSSGMYVRLAFAVAIHVEPEILIVDEALSVGDEAFQRKCFARIEKIRDDGATVLFVSHSASMILELCNKAILLDRGEMLAIGPPKAIVSRYQKLLYAPADKAVEIRASYLRELERLGGGHAQLPVSPPRLVERGADAPLEGDEAEDAFFDAGLVPQSTVRFESRGARIDDPHVETLDGKRVNVLTQEHEYVYTYTVSFQQFATSVRFGMLIKSVSGVELGGAVTSTHVDAIDVVEPGSKLRIRFRFRCLLAPGTYFLNAGVRGRVGEEETFLDRLVDGALFRVPPDPERIATGFVDFHVQPHVDVLGLGHRDS